jgi:L-glutamine-phosphate cytidylyltransferase
MKVVILGAGEGTRLRPYTLDRPKCMVEVDGRSLLDRQLAVLRAEKASPVILVGGYRAEKLERPDVSLRINPRFAETNMVWSLFAAEEELVGEVIVAYGDIVYSRHILREIMRSPSDISVAIDLEWESYWRARNEDPLADAETLKLASDGRILELGQRPTSLAEIQGQYMGIMKFSATGVETLKRAFHEARTNGIRGKTAEKAYMTDMLQSLIDSGERLQAVPVRGGWVEVDTVDDLHAATTRQRLEAIARELDSDR